MLRYETEFTPCTGITAVTRQERRHFVGGVMIAPWCPQLKRKPNADPVALGQVRDTGWSFKISGRDCRVLTTTDDFCPLVYLAIPGRFQGIETPYDVPPSELRRDAFWFGL